MYSVTPNLLGNGYTVMDGCKLLSSVDLVTRLETYEKNRAILLAGLTLIRYGTIVEKAEWLSKHAPETYGTLDELLVVVDPNAEFTNAKDGSLTVWIANELIEILQEED